MAASPAMLDTDRSIAAAAGIPPALDVQARQPGVDAVEHRRLEAKEEPQGPHDRPSDRQAEADRRRPLLRTAQAPAGRRRRMACPMPAGARRGRPGPTRPRSPPGSPAIPRARRPAGPRPPPRWPPRAWSRRRRPTFPRRGGPAGRHARTSRASAPRWPWPHRSRTSAPASSARRGATRAAARQRPRSRLPGRSPSARPRAARTPGPSRCEHAHAQDGDRREQADERVADPEVRDDPAGKRPDARQLRPQSQRHQHQAREHGRGHGAAVGPVVVGHGARMPEDIAVVAAAAVDHGLTAKDAPASEPWTTIRISIRASPPASGAVTTTPRPSAGTSCVPAWARCSSRSPTPGSARPRDHRRRPGSGRRRTADGRG